MGKLSEFTEFFDVDTETEPYLFEPEYSGEELQELDAERARREAESEAARTGEARWCRCGTCHSMPRWNSFAVAVGILRCHRWGG